MRALGACLAVLLAACGSTASSGGGGSRGALGGDGLGVPTSSGTTPDREVESPGSASTAGPSSGILGDRPESAAGARGSIGAARVAIPSRHPGISATEIKIGVALADDLDTIGSFGVSMPGPTADQAKYAIRVVFDDINRRGGVAGRKLVPVIQGVPYLTGGSFDSQSQSMCEHFTVDNKVFAVVMATNNHSTLLPSCLAQRDTLMLDGTNSVYFDDVEMRPFRSIYYRPGGLAIERWDVYIDALVAQGQLKAGNRIGLLRYDLPQQERMAAQVIRPALARHGLSVEDEFAYSYIESSASVSETSAQSGNAVLQFRTAGIDRVLYMASQGPIPFTFMQAAEQQQYRPGYGLTSTDGPDFLSTNVSAEQLRGARGVGWYRSVDVGIQRWPEHPTWRRCAAVMAKAGLTDPGFASGCDAYWFIENVLKKAPELSTAGFRSAVDALGNGFSYASGWGTRFVPGAAMGASAVRDLAFIDECTCFKYVGSPRPAL